jgi:hypothetical protein
LSGLYILINTTAMKITTHTSTSPRTATLTNYGQRVQHWNYFTELVE